MFPIKILAGKKFRGVQEFWKPKVEIENAEGPKVLKTEKGARRALSR